MAPRPVHQLFEDRARETPDAAAVVDGARSLTYRELDEYANRLARRLRREGIGSDEPVAICAFRSAELIGSVLAVNKAGAAYLPLDPSLPSRALAEQLAGTGARLVVTTRSTWARLELEAPAPLFLDDPKLLEGEGHAPLGLALHLDQLAYVISTSGSTGRPKAIEMPHRLLCNLLEWHAANLPKARTAQYASFSLDVAFQDIYGTLATGGTLVLVPEELRVDVFAMCQFLRDERIERVYLPVIAVIELAEAVARGAELPAALRDVVSAGEQLKVLPTTRELFERLGAQARLHNHYGPAETHLTHAATLTAPAAAWPDLPAIGSPIDGAKVYLLDASLEPVAPGAEGELYLGGNVSRGYRHEPAHTAERFLPDPFSSERGARMYRSGDLAVQRPDGTYEFRGRADFQVKILGFRVEPEQVEATLARCPSIASVAVVAIGDSSDDPRRNEQRLVAYFVPRSPGPELARDLQRFAKEHLPAHMVPAFFHAVDALPLSRGGKLDRRALMKSAGQLKRQPSLDGERVAPRNATETVLVDLWRELLDVEQVGIEDDFFMLGGNSLRGIRMLAQLHELLDVHVTLETLFNHRTIGALSSRLRETPEQAAALDARADVVLRITQLSDEEVAAELSRSADQ